MRVSDRCYAVTGLGYSTPWCVNAGFVAGDSMTLIVDTGANRLAAQSIHGYAVAATPGNELRVINTEKHFDHIGGNSFFRELGIDVWGHVGITRTAAEFETELTEFNEGIENPARRARGEAGAFFHGTQLANPNCSIAEDTVFELGGCRAEILLTPGHTPTNVSVWIPSDGVLFTGDCLIREYLPNLDAGGVEDWRVWLASLERVEKLKPVVVVAGHGPVSRADEVGKQIESLRRILHESILRGTSPTRC
jgi:glyoxylase-like metal-dependent hydrolase (beta-lactamase superfamily II)